MTSSGGVGRAQGRVGNVCRFIHQIEQTRAKEDGFVAALAPLVKRLWARRLYKRWPSTFPADPAMEALQH